jgi:hypothetical protein
VLRRVLREMELENPTDNERTPQTTKPGPLPDVGAAQS